MRVLTKGNNYLFQIMANPKISNKNNPPCECKEMQLFIQDRNANVWSYVYELLPPVSHSLLTCSVTDANILVDTCQFLRPAEMWKSASF